MTSSSELCRDIFNHFSDEGSNFDNSGSNRARSTIRGVSIASQFKSSLQNLVGDLEETEPHYIRCIKPNLRKTSNDFDAGEVLRQLRYAGMLETIRIRREGYALREPHESFYNKFHILLDSEDLKEGEGIEHLVKVLSKRLSVTSVDWQIGHSKIFLRRELATKLDALMSLRVRSAARTVGRFGRRVAYGRAGQFITVWARFRLQMYRKHKELRSCIKIQSWFRKMNQRKIYEDCRKAIITIQSAIRMALAFKILSRLRDPYRDMTFGEMKELYRAEKECLECAVATKDYELAAEIEKKLIPLKEALEKKRPLSRALLDKMIEDIEIELKEALAQKRYNDCPPLQQKLDELHEKRILYPTVSELRQKVIEAEKAVDEAAANRDFTGAAARQVDVENAKLQLAEALVAEKENYEELSVLVEEEVNAFSSRSQLEQKVNEVKDEIGKAIDSKNFRLASSLQEELDNLEARREDFPTLLELEQRCSSIESQMAEAIASKDYSRAAYLQGDIDSLKERIQREKSLVNREPTENEGFSDTKDFVSTRLPNGDFVKFFSRTELDLTLSQYAAKVDECAK
jgi:myosin heavy subunit